MEKTLPFTSIYGMPEEVWPYVRAYRDNGRLYVGLYAETEDGPMPFTDITVNLPHEPASQGEAYIKDFNENTGILEFIQKHRLGTLLPEVGHSGLCEYRKIAFDLDRLREFDRDGVDQYLEQGREKKRAPKKRRESR